MLAADDGGLGQEIGLRQKIAHQILQAGSGLIQLPVGDEFEDFFVALIEKPKVFETGTV